MLNLFTLQFNSFNSLSCSILIHFHSPSVYCLVHFVLSLLSLSCLFCFNYPLNFFLKCYFLLRARAFGNSEKQCSVRECEQLGANNRVVLRSGALMKTCCSYRRFYRVYENGQMNGKLPLYRTMYPTSTIYQPPSRTNKYVGVCDER